MKEIYGDRWSNHFLFLPVHIEGHWHWLITIHRRVISITWAGISWEYKLIGTDDEE